MPFDSMVRTEDRLTRCRVGYSDQGMITKCTHADGHGKVGPGGQNKTLFDHGNAAKLTFWNNDSTYLVVDHGTAEYPRFTQDHASAEAMGAVVADVSRWIDDSPRNRTNTFTENLLLRTTAKVGEEFGELNEALISMLGQNPRKPGGASMTDVEKELLDIAFTAIGAVEHINNNDGLSMLRFADHIVRVANRMQASEREAIRKRAEFMKAAKDFPVVPVVEMDPTCTECDRDNRNGTHDALERTGHLSHPFTP
jgi:hypothetical protein